MEGVGGGLVHPHLCHPVHSCDCSYLVHLVQKLLTYLSSAASSTATAAPAPEAKGDPEMAPVYVRRFLPMFCATFMHTMLASVKKVRAKHH